MWNTTECTNRIYRLEASLVFFLLKKKKVNTFWIFCWAVPKEGQQYFAAFPMLWHDSLWLLGKWVNCLENRSENNLKAHFYLSSFVYGHIHHPVSSKEDLEINKHVTSSCFLQLVSLTQQILSNKTLTHKSLSSWASFPAPRMWTFFHFRNITAKRYSGSPLWLR